MSTKYDLRSDPGVEKNYGKLLLEMVSVVPDGVVCFFVSYSYMDGIVNSWHESGILKVSIQKNIFMERHYCPKLFEVSLSFGIVLCFIFPFFIVLQEIMQHKLVFIETQDVVETTLALDNYRKACDCGRGAVFFSVAR